MTACNRRYGRLQPYVSQVIEKLERTPAAAAAAPRVVAAALGVVAGIAREPGRLGRTVSGLGRLHTLTPEEPSGHTQSPQAVWWFRQCGLSLPRVLPRQLAVASQLAYQWYSFTHLRSSSRSW